MKEIVWRGLIDCVYSDDGKYSGHFNGVDVTEFFRLNECFGIGYGFMKDALQKSIEHRLSSSPQLNEGIGRYIGNLEEQGELYFIKNVADRGLGRALSLAEGNYMNPKSNTVLFEGKNAIVTGSETGIGRAVALEFARRGAKVALHYPYEKFSRGAFSAVDLIKESGGKAEAFQGDFREYEEIERFTQDAVGYLGHVDVLVNNAGITLNKPFLEVTPQDFEILKKVNEGGNYFVTQKVVPHMPKGGVILNMASNHAIRAQAGHSVYAGTKGGVTSASRVLAIELAPRGIRVNSINPGGVSVVEHFRLLPEEDFTKFGDENTPIGLDTPENFARGVVILASDDLNSLTGQNIVLDRGLSACMNGGNSMTIGDVGFGKRYL
ncbi:MAG: SDR family oxidoreductase [archaeon]